MPIFVFECNQCKNVFEELLLSASEEEGVQCSQCGSRELKRKISGFHVIRPSSEIPQCMDSCGIRKGCDTCPGKFEGG